MPLLAPLGPTAPLGATPLMPALFRPVVLPLRGVPSEPGIEPPGPLCTGPVPLCNGPVPLSTGPLPLSTGSVPLCTRPAPLLPGQVLSCPVPLCTGPVPLWTGPLSLLCPRPVPSCSLLSPSPNGSMIRQRVPVPPAPLSLPPAPAPAPPRPVPLWTGPVPLLPTPEPLLAGPLSPGAVPLCTGPVPSLPSATGSMIRQRVPVLPAPRPLSCRWTGRVCRPAVALWPSDPGSRPAVLGTEAESSPAGPALDVPPCGRPASRESPSAPSEHWSMRVALGPSLGPAAVPFCSEYSGSGPLMSAAPALSGSGTV